MRNGKVMWKELDRGEIMGVMELARKTTEIVNPVYRTHGLSVRVKILDVRQVFSRVDFLITPIAGTGETWVSEEMITGSH